MTPADWQHIAPEWTHAGAAVEPARLWATSGGQWLTDPAIGVPVGVVRALVELVEYLDRHGAGLADISTARGVGVVAERAACLGLPPSGAVTAGGAGRLLPCRDGWVAVTLARESDVDAIPAWLDVPRPGPDPWPVVERAVATRTVAEVRDRAALLGLACGALGERSAEPSPLRCSRRGEAGALPVAGLVVVSLASLWAGPLAADVLARLGARVITVESTTRPDGARATPEFFEALHGRCQSVALPLGTGEGRRRLSRLLERADVVIEGSRPRALEQMGIDAAELVTRGPRLWVSITAHGRTGDAAMRVGFGDDAAVAGGLVGWVDREPRFLADAIADPLAGLTAASAVVQLASTGGRWMIDVALARVAAAARAQFAPVEGDAAPPRRRRDPGAPLPLGRDTDAVLADLGIR